MSWLRDRLNARLEDKDLPERLDWYEKPATMKVMPYLPPQPGPTPEDILRTLGLNADGTIAIKGEAAEQLKALIRQVLDEMTKA